MVAADTRSSPGWDYICFVDPGQGFMSRTSSIYAAWHSGPGEPFLLSIARWESGSSIASVSNRGKESLDAFKVGLTGKRRRRPIPPVLQPRGWRLGKASDGGEPGWSVQRIKQGHPRLA